MTTLRVKRAGAQKRAPVVFMTTFPSRKAAEGFAKKAVSLRLAACVNVVTGVTSFYRWKGKNCREKEILALGKTTKIGFARLKNCIGKLHPYETPELIAIEVVDGLPAYLRWLVAAVATR